MVTHGCKPNDNIQVSLYAWMTGFYICSLYLVHVWCKNQNGRV